MDGVGFGRRLQGLFRSPRDPRVHEALVEGARELVEAYSAGMAYVGSDEVSLVFLAHPPYDGRLEKLLSVPASRLAASVTGRLGVPVFFDGKVILLRSPGEALAYLAWRRRVVANNYLAQLYHKGRRAPRTPLAEEMLASVDLSRVEAELAAGTCLYWEEYTREAVNPLTGERVAARRRRLVRDPACQRLLDHA